MFSLKMDYTNYFIGSIEGNVFLDTRSLVDIRGGNKKNRSLQKTMVPDVEDENC